MDVAKYSAVLKKQWDAPKDLKMTSIMYLKPVIFLNPLKIEDLNYLNLNCENKSNKIKI